VSRLNFLLLLIVVICALSVVNATNRQRELFIALGRGQMQERQLQQELARLQYQQSALSKTTRVEGAATSDLKMQPVTAGRTQYLTIAGTSTTAADDAASGPVPTSASSGASSTANASEIAAITSGTVPAGASSPAGSSASPAASSAARSASTASRARSARASSASAATAGASQ
jgi:cell division protein FtsL